VPSPENGKAQIIVKRRRTRRHRQHLLIRRWLSLALLAVFTTGVSSFAARYFGPSIVSIWQSKLSGTGHASPSREESRVLDEVLSQVRPSRPLYAYSVVPGGVSDAKELKWVAEHDPVVAEHYAGFDYDHARVVEVTLARTAFVSYRIGNHIYWMRRRISLHKGEKLITDGRITARGRCGNRVAENPQAEVSPAEPSPERMENPMDGAGTVMPAPPVPFESALLNRPSVPGSGPEGPLNVTTPFGGGNLIAIAPPAFPVGLCAPLPKKGSTAISAIEGGALTNGKKKLGPCGTGGQGPSTVPEPATWMLLMTGLTAILWQLRRKLSPA
jgi:hypothetical protein